MRVHFKLIWCILVIFSTSVSGQVPTEKEKEKWLKLYPKLNSKMARMEEILNFTDRFIENFEFREVVLENLVEFIFLTESSKKNFPGYLEKEDKKRFCEALDRIMKVGKELYLAIEKKDSKKAKLLFLKMDTIRRKSHSKWAN